MVGSREMGKRILAAAGAAILGAGCSDSDKREQFEQRRPVQDQALLDTTAATTQGKTFELYAKYGKIISIVTGGQTGVDRAAMDFALDAGLPMRGFCPKGRLAEDGTINARYPLQETDSELPEVRTELNVIYSDGTLIISEGQPKDGTPLTERAAEHHAKPVFHLELNDQPDAAAFWKWMSDNNIEHLNVAGPRESHAPGKVYRRGLEILRELFDPKHLN